MHDEFTIRRYEDRDEEHAVALWNDVLPDSQPWNEPRGAIRRKLRTGDGLFFVGESDGRVVATVMAGYDGHRGWIYSLAVAPHCRRRGFGRRIMEHAERALQARGCPKVNLQVRSSNAAVVAFYQRLGYEIEDRLSLGKPLPSMGEDEVPSIAVSDSIQLTDFEWSDRDACIAHLNETEEFRRFTLTIPYPYTEADFEWWMGRRSEKRREQPPSISWAIREESGALIGACGLKSVARGHQAEVGYWLARPFWGRAIMTAVVQALCEFAEREFELVRLTAHVFAENAASARVLEKNGFKCEGLLRKHVLKDGQFLDSRLYTRVR